MGNRVSSVKEFSIDSIVAGPRCSHICLEPGSSAFFVYIQPCGHLYHEQCIKPRLAVPPDRARCPTCGKCLQTRQATRNGTPMKEIIVERFMVMISLIGDSYVGKSVLLKRYFDGEYDPNLLLQLMEVRLKDVDVLGGRVRLWIQKIQGQERFKTIAPTYLERSHGIMIAYDTACGHNRRNVEEWYDFVTEYAPKAAAKILVGTKKDLTHCSHPGCDCSATGTHAGNVAAWGQGLDIECVEASAAEGTNVERVFGRIIMQALPILYKRHEEQFADVRGARLAAEKQRSSWRAF